MRGIRAHLGEAQEGIEMSQIYTMQGNAWAERMAIKESFKEFYKDFFKCEPNYKDEREKHDYYDIILQIPGIKEELYINEKVAQYYPRRSKQSIFLETWSVAETGIRGWVYTIAQHGGYVAYGWANKDVGGLQGLPLLFKPKQELIDHINEVIDTGKAKEIPQHNDGYTSKGIFESINNVMSICGVHGYEQLL
jgi:hypothetical protein